jgi:4'-phosphopantetheinyl transferase EntD
MTMKLEDWNEFGGNRACMRGAVDQRSDAVLWSVMRPDRRIWPPQTFGSIAAFVGWAGTLAFLATVVALGVLGWGEIQVLHWLPYVVGSI